MITVQKVTSNVQRVPRQSPDIYWHAELCSRRPCSVYYVITVSDWNCLKYFCVFCTVIVRCTETFNHPVYNRWDRFQNVASCLEQISNTTPQRRLHACLPRCRLAVVPWRSQTRRLTSASTTQKRPLTLQRRNSIPPRNAASRDFFTGDFNF
jgi:hypothetical protein